MAVVSQVVIGLLTTFVGFALGFTWHVSRRKLTYWRARHFWRPFVSGDLKIVVGRFKDFDTFEASGLVGVGDMQAAAEVVSFFDDLGLRRLGSAIDIVYHDQLAGNLYAANLVCIGGPDANQVTERILKNIHHTIELESGVISIRDTRTGEIYEPNREHDRDNREIVVLDYGLLIQAPNPFDSHRSVMIVAGGYGYGTWAGVKLARSPQFLHSELASKGQAIECLYRTEIIREVPQKPEVVLVRQISS